MARRKIRVEQYRFIAKVARWALSAVAGLLVLGFIPIAHDSFPEAVRKMAHSTGIDSCVVGKVTVSLWRGASIVDVWCSKRDTAGGEIRLIAPRVTISLRTFYILANRDAFSRFMDQFSHERRGIPPPARRGRDGERLSAPEPSMLLGAMSHIRVSDARIQRTATGSDTLNIDGVRARIEVRDAAMEMLRMSVKADSCTAGSWRIDDPVVVARSDQKEFVVSKFHGQFYGGRIEGELTCRTDRSYIEQGTLRVRGVDLKKVHESRPGFRGTLTGRADFEFALEKGLWHPEYIRGGGGFELRNVTPDGIPILSTIVVSLTVPQLSRIHLDRLSGTLVLDSGKVFCRDVRGEGHPIAVGCSGFLLGDGSMNFDVTARFKPEYKDSLSALAWNALIPTEDDGRQFLCTVSGTYDTPRIHVHRDITRRAVRSVFKSIGSSLRSAFGR